MLWIATPGSNLGDEVIPGYVPAPPTVSPLTDADRGTTTAVDVPHRGLTSAVASKWTCKILPVSGISLSEETPAAIAAGWDVAELLAPTRLWIRTFRILCGFGFGVGSGTRGVLGTMPDIGRITADVALPLRLGQVAADEFA